MTEVTPRYQPEQDQMPIRARSLFLGSIATGVGTWVADQLINLPIAAEVIGYTASASLFAVGCLTATFDILKAGGYGPRQDEASRQGEPS